MHADLYGHRDVQASAWVWLVSGPPGNPGPQPPSSPSGAPGQPTLTLPGGTQQPAPQTCSPTKPLTSTAIDCLAGVVAGIGDCVQGNVNTIAGAGYFFMGDFVDAAKMWGCSRANRCFLALSTRN